MIPKTRLISSSIAAAAASLALAAPSGAAVYCAEIPAPCDPAGGTHTDTLAQALTTAAVVGGKDKIVLGAKTYVTGVGFVYESPLDTNGVEIVGQGSQTVLKAEVPVKNGFRVLRVHAPDSLVRNLDIEVPQSSGGNPTVGLSLAEGARTTQIDVRDDGAPGGADVGIRGFPGTEIDKVQVHMNDDLGTAGIQALQNRSTTVTDSDITAGTAVRAEQGGSATVTSSRLTGRRGAFANGGHVGLFSSLVSMQAGVAAGLHASALGNETGIGAFHVTILTASANNIPVLAASTNADDALVWLQGSVIHGPHQTALQRFATGSGSAAIKTFNSAYTGQLSLGSGAGTIDQSDRITADPMLVDPANGDVRLKDGSPLIDRGTTEEPEMIGPKDVYGDVRRVDGDQDGKIEPDVGAAEHGVPAPAPAPAEDLPGEQPPAADPQPQEPTRPSGEPVPPAGDRLAPTLGALKLVRRGTRVRFTLTEAAKVTLKVQRRKAGKWRTLKTIAVAGRAGRNERTLRGVRRGRGRRILAVATDAAGNRSTARKLSLRAR